MLHSKVRVLCAKLETAPGDAEPLTKTEALYVYDPQLEVDEENEDRQGLASYAPEPSYNFARSGTLTFSVDVCARASAEAGVPKWTDLLQACRWGYTAEGKVFSPVDTPPEAAGSLAKTVTFGYYEDGLAKILYGAAGSWEITAQAGKVVRIKFTFKGIYVPRDDVPLPEAVYEDITPLRMSDTALALGAATPRVANVTLASGNEVELREDVAAANDSGYAFGTVSGGYSTATIDPEAEPAGDWDPEALRADREEQAFALTLSDGTFDVAFACTAAQVRSVKRAERGNILADQVTLQFNAPLTIAFS